MRISIKLHEFNVSSATIQQFIAHQNKNAPVLLPHWETPTAHDEIWFNLQDPTTKEELEELQDELEFEFWEVVALQ